LALALAVAVVAIEETVPTLAPALAPLISIEPDRADPELAPILLLVVEAGSGRCMALVVRWAEILSSLAIAGISRSHNTGCLVARFDITSDASTSAESAVKVEVEVGAKARVRGRLENDEDTEAVGDGRGKGVVTRLSSAVAVDSDKSGFKMGLVELSGPGLPFAFPLLLLPPPLLLLLLLLLLPPLLPLLLLLPLLAEVLLEVPLLVLVNARIARMKSLSTALFLSRYLD
jgi:hypothetical protein